MSHKTASIRIIVKKPNEAPTIEHIARGLEGAQAVVGGLIDVVRLAPGLDLVINDEGLIRSLEPNFSVLGAFGALPIVGAVFFVGVDADGDFVGLTDEQIAVVGAMWIRGHVGLLVPDDDDGDGDDDDPGVDA
jgi:hypothetical protein